MVKTFEECFFFPRVSERANGEGKSAGLIKKVECVSERGRVCEKTILNKRGMEGGRERRGPVELLAHTPTHTEVNPRLTGWLVGLWCGLLAASLDWLAGWLGREGQAMSAGWPFLPSLGIRWVQG